MKGAVHASAVLTKNQSLVMEALTESDGPLSAYGILDELRDRGFRAPPQVYRALEKLVEFGMVHRLESLNAFVACRHSGCDNHEAHTFMICDSCGLVRENADNSLSTLQQNLADEAHFVLKKATVELRGICGVCHTASN